MGLLAGKALPRSNQRLGGLDEISDTRQDARSTSMNSSPISHPPSATTLPALDDMPRAGSPEEQIALQDSAWAMLETYTAPSGHTGTRLSNAWLGERDWSVQLFHYRDLAPGNQAPFEGSSGPRCADATASCLALPPRLRCAPPRSGACRPRRTRSSVSSRRTT